MTGIRLSETLVNDSLDQLNWPLLKGHLDEILLDVEAAEEIGSKVLRRNRLLQKHPDPGKKAARDSYFQALIDHIKDNVGISEGSALAERLSRLSEIERGYHGILGLLASADISKLAPEQRVTAYLLHAANECDHLFRKTRDSGARFPELIQPSNFVFQDESGRAINPDNALNCLVEVIGTTLVMESYKNRWVGAKGRIILPPLVEISDADIDLAAQNFVCAVWWQIWEEAEQRVRYFDAKLTVYNSPDFPDGTPDQLRAYASQLVAVEPDEDEIAWEIIDKVADARLSDRLGQIYHQLLLTTNVSDKARGIDIPVPLPPSGFVSVEEVHSLIAICEILGFSITNDSDEFAGLRILEWLRGYAALRCLSEKCYSSAEPIGLLPKFEKASLESLLQRVGLSDAKAAILIDHLIFSRDPSDLFDKPLLQFSDGELILFGPAILFNNLTKVVLSALSRLRDEQVERKGKAFEQQVLKNLEENGLQCKSFKKTRDGEEYEYDVVALWNDHLFLFECKNRSLSELHPIQSYYARVGLLSNVKQVLRLKSALERFPDILEEEFGTNVLGKPIVACVVNSLPLSVPGGVGGVFFSDASALQRFFQEKYINAIQPFEIGPLLKVIQKVGLRALWSGDAPTAEDLIKQLDRPVQFDLLRQQLRMEAQWARLSDGVVAAYPRLVFKPATLEAKLETLGTDAAATRAELNLVREAVMKLNAKISQPTSHDRHSQIQ